MKRLAQGLVGLYPRWWRARYGTEFHALLDDAHLEWRDVMDVMIGALRMRIAKGESCAMDETKPLPRIVNLASRDIPRGYELESTVEYQREDGITMLVRNFYREVDLGDSYITLNHSARGSEPAQTILVWGVKGEVSGDFRTDQTEMLVLRADGTIQRTEQTVQTWLKYDGIRDKLRDRYRSGMKAGLTPDDIYREIQAENYGSANA